MKQIEDQRTPEEMLEEFQATFQTPNTPEFWRTLVIEEAKEVEGALVELLKEVIDMAYVLTGYDNAGGDLMDLTDIAPRLDADLLEGIMQAFGGPRLEKAFRAVHYNNMSKVQPDGTVKRREDGKVLKPEGYRPVDLTSLIR